MNKLKYHVINKINNEIRMELKKGNSNVDEFVDFSRKHLKNYGFSKNEISYYVNQLIETFK